MAARRRTRIESKFPQAREAGKKAVAKAVDDAVNDGVEEARRRLDGIRDTKGYDLNPLAVNKSLFKGGEEGGMAFVPTDRWYYRFFEYGTVYISASPFMRPAHRKMKKTFVEKMGDDFEGFVRRRARLR